MKKLALALALSVLSSISSSPSAQATQAALTARSYADVTRELKRIADTHPDHASPFELGLSDSGETIRGLKIGNGPVQNLVVATHHGNEYGSTEVALAFAEDLALRPIDGQTLFVIPVLNISGYNRRARREDARGRSWDPNRNYPGPCGTEGPFTLKSTRALADFIERQKIVASATLHTYFPAVVWPWGLSSHDLSTPHDSDFEKLASAATIESKYQIGNSTEVVYAADGTFEDYAYWKHGIWSLLFELGFSHSPSDSQVREMIRANLPGLRRMFEQAPTVRATEHAFTGKCDVRLKAFDRHDE
jgi:carboxypeptidase T